jgi:tRNA pseudouridine65 synthase
VIDDEGYNIERSTLLYASSDDNDEDDDDVNENMLPLLQNLQEGIPKGFYVIKEYTYLPDTFILDHNYNSRSSCCSNSTAGGGSSSSSSTGSQHITDTGTADSSSSILIRQLLLQNSINTTTNYEYHIQQRNLVSSLYNVTVPIALCLLDPITYPSLSRARKACRKGTIVIIRQQQQQQVLPEKFIGRVGDRIYHGDTIGIQVRVSNNNDNINNCYPNCGHVKPPFDLPVIYQDDYVALVNKPSGVVCYRQGDGHIGLLSIRAMLPFVLIPPKYGIYSILRRPTSVHRLDKPTSGILCIVKTKPALVTMSKQFHDRIVQKTYTAIVNGIPYENPNTSLSSEQVMALGVDVDDDCDDLKECDRHQYSNNNNITTTTKWQMIDTPLNNQSAITIWRILQSVPSIRGTNGYISKIEIKLKTGRYHQIRRHFAWYYNTPIIGDTTYDGGHPNALSFRNNGLFLCATRIQFQHPYYNTLDGRNEWDSNDNPSTERFSNGSTHNINDNNSNNKKKNTIVWYNTKSDKVTVSATIELPNKFDSLLSREKKRHEKFMFLPTK